MTNMQFEDESFDYIIASMVLEHINDEKMALMECKRVIKKNGKIILIVPIAEDISATEFDPSINNDEDRKRLYGQKDHVRLYGMDYREHFKKFGFKVISIEPKDYFDINNIKSRGLEGIMPIIILSNKL